MREDIKEKAKKYKILNEVALKNEVVILGSSYMFDFPFYEFMQGHITDYAVYNRSIEGLKIKEATETVEDSLKYLSPGIILVALGEEDEETEESIADYRALVKKLKSLYKNCKIYIMQPYGKSETFCYRIKRIAEENGLEYVEMSGVVGLNRVFGRLSAYFHREGISFSDAFGRGC